MPRATAECQMVPRGFVADASRKCRQDGGRMQYLKESDARGHLITWFACSQCQAEFLENPGTAANTPYGYNDLEWQTEDLVDLKPFDVGPDLDRTIAHKKY